MTKAFQAQECMNKIKAVKQQHMLSIQNKKKSTIETPAQGPMMLTTIKLKILVVLLL
jgi:hypothetical protein